jgi:hypothetical protein
VTYRPLPPSLQCRTTAEQYGPHMSMPQRRHTGSTPCIACGLRPSLYRAPQSPVCIPMVWGVPSPVRWILCTRAGLSFGSSVVQAASYGSTGTGIGVHDREGTLHVLGLELSHNRYGGVACCHRDREGENGAARSQRLGYRPTRASNAEDAVNTSTAYLLMFAAALVISACAVHAAAAVWLNDPASRAIWAAVKLLLAVSVGTGAGAGMSLRAGWSMTATLPSADRA